MAVHPPGNKDVLERRLVTAGKKVVREGDKADCAFLIQSGKVQVYTGNGDKRVDLAVLGPGQIFGEMALCHEEKRTATVEALEDTGLIVITESMFDAKLEKSDPTIRAIVPMLTKRIINTNVSLLRRQSDLQALVDTVTEIYTNIRSTLPAPQKQTLEDTVLPRLDDLMKAINDFRDKYVVINNALLAEKED